MAFWFFGFILFFFVQHTQLSPVVVYLLFGIYHASSPLIAAGHCWWQQEYAYVD